MMLERSFFSFAFVILLGISSSVQAVQLMGELTQGGLLLGKVAPSSIVTLNGKEIRVTPEGDFVIGFGRDAAVEHVIGWGSSLDKLLTKTVNIVPRKYNTQYVEGVPQKTVNPPKSRLERIRKETALVKKARKMNSSLLFFKEKFIPPIKGRITGVYGSQRVYNGVPGRPHYGIDYAGPVGEPVYAPASGVVSLTHDDMYYSGGTLIVDHGYGVSSTFIHLSEIVVQEGQKVAQGEMIAKVGQGGRSTGPHLDWRVNWYDVRVDPQLVLKINE